MEYLVSRLFVHNLFICCGISDKDFHTNLNQITYDIIKNKIDQAQKLLGATDCVEDAESLLSKSFFKKLDEMKLYSTAESKNKDYFLVSIYNEIWTTCKRIERRDLEKCKIPPSDINSLEEFRKCLNKLFYECGVESVSYKTLQQILKVSVTNYKKGQAHFVDFLLTNIFPRVDIPSSPGFLATLETHSWDELIFTDCSLATNDIHLPHNAVDFENIKYLFDELFDLSVSNYESIGNKLVEIYKKLTMCRLEDNNNAVDDNKINAENSHNLYSASGYDDSTLSTHIISFMRWIPIMSEEGDGFERMKFVERILDCIGDEVREKLRGRYTVQDFINSKTSLFIWDQNDDLRALLMHAMSHEQYFYKCFQEYYKDSFQCNVGRIINE